MDLCSILRFIRQVQLLLILMFTRMATETRKRAHFKYVIKSKLFSTCGSITHSVSICLMTYSRCRQLCHTPLICLTWREIIAEKFHLPSCSSTKILPLIFGEATEQTWYHNSVYHLSTLDQCVNICDVFGDIHACGRRKCFLW